MVLVPYRNDWHSDCAALSAARAEPRAVTDGEPSLSNVRLALACHVTVPTRMQPAHRLVSALARTHLGQVSGRRREAFVTDILFLGCGVRSAVLLDHFAVEAGGSGGEDGDGFVPASGVLTIAVLRRFLDSLRSEMTWADSLALLRLGPSLFVIDAAELSRRIGADLENRLDGIGLVAADEELPMPRACTQSERDRLRASLTHTGRLILRALTAAAADRRTMASAVADRPGLRRIRGGPRGGAAGGDDGGVPLVALDGSFESLLVPLHGWLLEYPSLYAFTNTAVTRTPVLRAPYVRAPADAGAPGAEVAEAAEAGAQNGLENGVHNAVPNGAAAADDVDGADAHVSAIRSCLSGVPLRVYRLVARRRDESGRADRGPSEPRLVCSFSLPADDADTSADHPPEVREWRARMEARFASARAASVWEPSELEVVTRTQEAVVL